jgi:hypothetical protein
MTPKRPIAVRPGLERPRSLIRSDTSDPARGEQDDEHAAALWLYAWSHDALRPTGELLARRLTAPSQLRRDLAALGSRDGAAPPSTGATPSAAPERAGRRAQSAPASRTATREPARPRSSTSTAASAAPVQPAEPPARRRPRAAPRTARGATKTAVFQTLSGGDALTAGQVVTATALARGTVSTALSKLAKSGEVTKAARGYQLAGQPTPGAPTDAAVSAENEQPGPL